MTDLHEELEVLDWLFMDGYVDEVIDKLEDLAEKYEATHVDVMLDKREYAVDRGLLQEVVVLGIPIANATY